MSPTIIIADDHPLILKGLLDFLNEKKFNVLASAKNGKEALALIKAHTPDIAILDIKMPFFTGMQIAEQCKAAQIPTKIILITFEKDEKTYNKARVLDIYGYVLKEFALDEIEHCITSVVKGEPYFSPDLLEHIEVRHVPEDFKKLSKSEIKIVKLISKNLTGVEIADLLFISTRTVEKHKSNIIKKLNLKSKQNSLLIWAKENSDFLNS